MSQLVDILDKAAAEVFNKVMACSEAGIIAEMFPDPEARLEWHGRGALLQSVLKIIRSHRDAAVATGITEDLLQKRLAVSREALQAHLVALGKLEEMARAAAEDSGLIPAKNVVAVLSQLQAGRFHTPETH